MIFEGREWLCWDTPLALKEVTAPDTPQANTLEIYAKDKSGVSALYYKDDAGNEKDLSGGLTGTGIANRVTYWSSATVLAANAVLTPTRIIFSDSNGLPTDDSGLIYDNTNKDLIVGIASSTPFATLVGRGISVVRSAGVIGEVDTYGFGIVGQGAIYRGIIARGTQASPTQSLADDGIAFTLTPRDNSVFEATAPCRIFLACAETQTTTAHGSYIALDTTPLLSVTRAERFRVGPSGQWGIGGATYGNAGDVFTSAGASAAPTWTAPVVPAIGGTITGGTVGSVLFVGTGPVFAQDNANFFWDDSGNKLGIGTTAPAARIDIRNVDGTDHLRLTNPNAPKIYAIDVEDSGLLSFIDRSLGVRTIVMNGLKMGIGNITGPTAMIQVRGDSSDGSTTLLSLRDSGDSQMLYVLSNGVVTLGQVAGPASGTQCIIMADGTAPSSLASNTAGLYANDVSGNVSIHVVNENGDIIKLIKTGTYTPSNVSADRSFDANSTSIDELADVLGTLIADLQLTGLIV